MDYQCCVGPDSLNSLNDDVLRMIFAYLPPQYRLKYELVSKRWNRVLKDSWLKFSSLDIQQFRGSVWPDPPNVNKIIVVLQRCGSFVKSVTFKGTALNELMLEGVLEAWVNEQPVCTTIDFSGSSLSVSAVQKLKAFTSLQCLKIGDGVRIGPPSEHDTEFDNVVGELFEALPELKELDMSGCRLTFSCLVHLTSAIETLTLDNARGMVFDSIDIHNNLFNRPLPNLKSLSLAMTRLCPVFVGFFENMIPNITTLDISYGVQFQEYPKLALLPHLTRLFLNSVFKGEAEQEAAAICLKALTDPDSMCRKNLVVIHLNDNNALTAQNLILLKKLPALREVSLEHVDNVNGELMEHMSVSCKNLEAVTVRGCSQFDDECLMKLAESALKLVYLDVSYCRDISANGMHGLAVSFTTSEVRISQGLALEVFAFGSSISYTGDELGFEACGAVKVHTDDEVSPPRRYKYAEDPNSDLLSHSGGWLSDPDLYFHSDYGGGSEDEDSDFVVEDLGFDVDDEDGYY